MATKIIDLPQLNTKDVKSTSLFEVSNNGTQSNKINGNQLRQAASGNYFNYPIKSGQPYALSTVGTGSSPSTPTQNYLSLLLVTFAQDIQAANFSINVTTAAVGGLAKIVIYTYDQSTSTIDMISNSGDLDCSTTGIKTYIPGSPINFDSPFSFYAIGVISNLSTITFSGIRSSNIPSYWANTVAGDTVNGIFHNVGSYSAPTSVSSIATSYLATQAQVFMTLNAI